MKRVVLQVITSLVITSSFAQQRLVFNNGCSYFGDAPKSDVYVFDPDNEAQQALARIMSFTKLSQNFILKAADVTNAEARILGNDRYILYNTLFIRKMKQDTKSEWTVTSVLAHEIGHHLANHPLGNANNRHEKELEADKYSGYVLCTMGASMDDAIAAISAVATDDETPSHPRKAARLQAIAVGWMQAFDNGEHNKKISKSPPTPVVASSLIREQLFEQYRVNGEQGRVQFLDKKFREALASFKTCLSAYDGLIKLGALPAGSFDTSATLNAGTSAYEAGLEDEAAWYYAQLADKKYVTNGFPDVYKWLASYCRKRGDLINTVKYLSHGRELYPGEQYWVEFEIVLLEVEKDKLQVLARYEQLIKNFPNQPMYHYYYATELHNVAIDTVNKGKYAYAKDLLNKAANQANLALSLGYDKNETNFVLGSIFCSLGLYCDIERNALPIRATPAQVIKKEELKNDMVKYFKAALTHFEIVESSLSNKASLQAREKINLEESYTKMSVIYDYLDNIVKSKEYDAKRKNLNK